MCDERFNEWIRSLDEDVILALAENMPEEAIEAAKATGLYATTEEVRAAIAAFLKHVGEGP